MPRMATTDLQDDDRAEQTTIRGVPPDTRAILVFPVKAMPPSDWRQPWLKAGWAVTTCSTPQQLAQAMARAATPALFVSLWQSANAQTPTRAIAQGLLDAAVACGTPEETTASVAEGANGMLRRGDFLDYLGNVTHVHAKGIPVLMAIRIDNVSELSSQLEATAIFALEEQVCARLATLVDPGDAYTIWLELGFGLLARRAHAEQARQLAERICARVAEESFTVAGKPRKLTVSVGVALAPVGSIADRAERWFATAHAAQAIAYRHGGNCVDGVLTREFDPIPAERVLIIREWVVEAKTGSNVIVEFQPVLPLISAAQPVYSVHAKLRDYRAPLGGVYRREYLRLAREAGAMVMIDRMSLFGAFEALEQEHARGLGTRLLVPIEPASLEGVPLQWLEAEVRRRWHLAEGLIVELEANQKIEHPDFVERLKKLRTLGVKIGLSDHALKLDRISTWAKLPLDVLRIQVAALNAITPDEFRERVAGWKNLGRQLIVDGVEKAGELGHFTGLGVDYLRGHALATIGPRLDFDFERAD
jgi:EAL domain-containing protein (putative c-di-GMP-specific phosphodiesterase class I)/GGDEF domain-containing protein